MFTVLSEHVFPFLRSLSGAGESEGSPAARTAFAHHMKDARFTIPTPALLQKVVDLLDTLPLDERDSGDAEAYSLILANPPFAGSLDHENTARNLQQTAKTKKTELLFLALFLRRLKTGGRAAVIVPDGVLSGSSKAHKELRRKLVEEQKLDAVISLPGGVFKPYVGVSTAILLFTKTMRGGTDHVWFYDCQADGWSLDDKRQPLLESSLLGLQPFVDGRNQLSKEKHDKNNLPDVLQRWRTLHPAVPTHTQTVRAEPFVKLRTGLSKPVPRKPFGPSPSSSSGQACRSQYLANRSG